jgi:SNF2 family DNA or RNA helicase
VGLGKTIEAGLVLKELLTRGMVKRFLVLTVPSLVDQWEEELSDKFGLATATTNQAAARGDSQRFWRENTGIIASLHTLKQPAQLEIARQEHWDMLVVDEAHYLRNRESQAWQAVDALPRQFLLLLTATPVQNSLEELYNLVTLLQPGQLPSPKEFRARFIDPKRPRQPREPEELRRLLGQVMIRNTRANAGLRLPPRRAETVLFEPEAAERGFWERWETEFRARLAQLSPGQASLWGRLVLQAAGSSPTAWRQALKKFPDQEAALAWSAQAPLETSWRRKCDLLAPLARVEGGVVIFTQFLETQAALAEELRREGVQAFVINGATPPPDRQPITESFHRQGGALLLTRSGTEGRNLQFSHRLANFDLPWNPMEIEQRIGRLHRLGQQQPVRIYNFVQAGTLQEHLLHLLQEKLNLFELVVGETGLVLGERFSSDEFAEEVLRRWRESEGRVAEAMAGLGEELAAARDSYGEIKKLDDTLFKKDYET